MKWGGVILTALLFAALPAAAQGSGPLPPVYKPSEYQLRGPLSNYVPATSLADGSITIRVDSSNGAAAFAVGQTLTFRVTTATQVPRKGIKNGDNGLVRLTSKTRVTTLPALQALPAATVVSNRAS